MIELLVVVAIIAVLIAILLPSLQSARVTAKTVTCQSNMRQLGVAMVMYREENQGAQFLIGWGWGSPSTHSFLHDYLYKYLGYSEPSGNAYYAWQPEAYNVYKIFYCPETPEIAYSQNALSVVASASGRFLSSSEVAGNPGVIQFCEAASWWAGYHGIGGLLGYRASEAYPYGVYDGRLSSAHRGTQNVTFIDGHVENMRLEEIDVGLNAAALLRYWFIALH